MTLVVALGDLKKLEYFVHKFERICRSSLVSAAFPRSCCLYRSHLILQVYRSPDTDWTTWLMFFLMFLPWRYSPIQVTLPKNPVNKFGKNNAVISKSIAVYPWFSTTCGGEIEELCPGRRSALSPPISQLCLAFLGLKRGGDVGIVGGIFWLFT